MHHFPEPTEIPENQPCRGAGVACISKDDFQTRRFPKKPLQQMRSRLTVMRLSAVDHYRQQQAKGVDDDVTLASGTRFY